jgi:hypothetical chaperone protein
MSSSERHVGIDFGTTNTAVGIAEGETVRLAQLPGRGGGAASTWRTVLFFEADGPVRAGAPAVERFIEVEGDGRLVQSIKSHLASASFSRTMILGKAFTIEALVATYLRGLRAASDVDLGARAVVGRPVRYWGARDAEDEARALARMRAALGMAGFSEVVFEYEPVAAALRYASTLDHEELILVADFGGGTSDFSLARVGSPHGSVMLGTEGVAIGGDSFDARVIDARVSPELGLGTSYRDEMGALTPVPSALFGKLRRWHHLSFLKEPATLRLLERIERGTTVPARIERLLRLVRDELALPLHGAVERSKVELSTTASGRLKFFELDLDVALDRADFDRWIAGELDTIDATVTRVLEQAGVAAGEVDAVFATGGSSLVPAVRERLAARFGASKLKGGEELTSVAWGLAARARELFGQSRVPHRP